MVNRASLLLILCWISGISSFAEYSLGTADAKRSQGPVDTSGKHAYQAPGPTDRRGPCPALNAMANNGYLNRNGVSSPEQFFKAGKKVGLAGDLSGLFATFAILAGTGKVFSIGAGSPTLGAGLDKHNFLEGDASYTRCDCNLCPRGNGCDNYDFNGKVWSTTANIAKTHGNLYGIPTFKLAAKKRYDQCRANNPKCTFGLIQFAFHYGTACIIAEVFPNGTDGLPTEAIENTWIGIVNDANGQPLDIQGRERIPTNWYPRKKPYTTVDFFSCMRKLYFAYPVELGANINGTFVPDKAQLPSNAKNRDIACILYGVLASATPPKLLSLVGKYVNSAFLGHPWRCGKYSASG